MQLSDPDLLGAPTSAARPLPPPIDRGETRRPGLALPSHCQSAWSETLWSSPRRRSSPGSSCSSSRPASCPVVDRSKILCISCMNQWEDWMQGRSALQVVVPHFLALLVSWVMMYATLAVSVGNVLGWRLKINWHCVRKLLHSPEIHRTSQVVVGKVCGSQDWTPEVVVLTLGQSEQKQRRELQEAGARCAAWTASGECCHLLGHGLHTLHDR